MNIRQLLPPVIAFVIACAGSTGTIIMRAKAAAQTDTVSSPAHAGAADSADAHADSVPDPTVYKVDSVVPPHAAPPAPAASIDTVVPRAKPPVAVVTATSAPSLMVDGRLAKMFAAMSARDAAKVFEQMTDSDVISLLGAMPDKRAAEILALLPATRSAVIAKAILARDGAS